MKRFSRLLLLATLGFGISTSFVACGGSEPVEEAPPVPVDTDGDGITDEEELALGLDPNSADSDGDGLSDGDEINLYKTDPLNADTDGDGLSDGDEVMSYNTDPLKSDTDGDGISDGDEVNQYKTNPTNPDSDGDGISDYDEIFTHKSNPNNADSDGDGFTDGQELEMGTGLLNASDPVYIKANDLQTINFAFDRSNLNDDAAKKLATNVELLQSNSKFKVRINAYTDHIGGEQYNLRLSKRRANAVVEFYKKNGVDESRIESYGLGKAPVPCGTEDPNSRGCRKNRRAESLPISPYKFTPSAN